MNFIERAFLKAWLKKEVVALSKYKTLTHVLAAIVAASYTFSLSDAGKAVVHQYPTLSGLVMLIGLLAALYHVPVKSSPSQSNPAGKIGGTAGAWIVMLILPLALLFCAAGASAQTSAPAPSQSTFSFNVGAGAFGLGASSNATPATDVAATLNPGIVKMPGFSFRSDAMLAPGANLQLYAGGVDYKLPKFSKTGLFSQVYFTLNGTFGLDRVVPASGPSYSGFGLMVGGAMHYQPSASVDTNLFQVGYLRTPHAPWGTSAPYFGGSISYFFGKSQ